MVTEKPRRLRDSLQAHYTTSPHIVAYMVSRLCATSVDTIWEPCAGAGNLIAGVLRVAPDARIHASEIDTKAAAALRKRFSAFPNVEITVEDALRVEANLFDGKVVYTRVIANPPYGAWQEHTRRRELKAKFTNLYVRDTYGVFLFCAFESLAPKGRLVFIVPDTFLWLHRHEFLRKHLFSNATVEEIALFPSRFFPGIHFGYSGLCIITLRKEFPNLDSTVRVLRRIREPAVLSALVEGTATLGAFTEHLFQQRTVRQHPHCALLLPAHVQIPTVDNGGTKLGDVAAVVTGFYSGDDRRWLRVATDGVRGSRYYRRVDPEKVADIPERVHPPLGGLKGKRCFIPIVRGGASPFVKPTSWFVDWSQEAVSEYRRKGKNPARFQNSQYYFRQGIGVPMVASSRLTAAPLDRRLFDQGIVGVFPHDDHLLKYVLAYLNTQLASELLRGINPTANNSANYLKRLPFVYPRESELREVNSFVDKAISEIRQGTASADQTGMAIEQAIRKIWARAERQPETGHEASEHPHPLAVLQTGGAQS